jgi:hypothetical protein
MKLNLYLQIHLDIYFYCLIMENITNIDSSVYLIGNALITYGKKVYRRHTDCFQKSVSYNLENNRVIIVPLYL